MTKTKTKTPAKKRTAKSNKTKLEKAKDVLDFECGIAHCLEHEGKSLDATIEAINAAVEYPVLVRADKAGSPVLLRRPFGLASLDIACAGGAPAGGTTQIEGLDGTGKNALLWHALWTNQLIYGKESRVGLVWFEGPPDKQQAKIVGAVIPLSDNEIELEIRARSEKNLLPLTEEQIMDRRQTIGEIVVAHHGSAEQRFDAAIDLVTLNRCQIVGIDSYGSIAAKQNIETPLSKDGRRAAVASLLSDFQRKLWNACANPASAGSMNWTSILALNQARAKQQMTGVMQKQWDVADPYAIKHGKILDIQLSKGRPIKKETVQIGKETGWQLRKGKYGCHEGPKGILRYMFSSGFDRYTDLVNVMNEQQMLISKKDKVDVVGDEGEIIADGLPHGKGYEELKLALAEDSALFWRLYSQTVAKAGVLCLYRLSTPSQSK